MANDLAAVGIRLMPRPMERAAGQAAQLDKTVKNLTRQGSDEARFLPIWELTALHATGPRVAVSGLGLIPLFAFSGPYEDVQLKG